MIQIFEKIYVWNCEYWPRIANYLGFSTANMITFFVIIIGFEFVVQF